MSNYTYRYGYYFGTTEQNPNIIYRSDGAVIPADPANTDYANIMKLVAAGELIIAPAGE